MADIPPLCTITGSPDLYGLGMRVSFYLLWFFVLIGERLHERHAQVPRVVELVLAYAVFLGLAMAASGGHLFAAEVYIALLLMSTTVYLLVPRHTTDLVAWIRPDLGLGTQRGKFGFMAGARCLFVLIVISLHLWFWGNGVDSASIDRNLRNQGGCCPCIPPPQIGFAFGPVEMHSGGFKALNVLLMLALLTGGVIIGAMKAGLIRKKKSRRRRRANRVRIRVLKEVETFGGLAVASILVAAIELTIRWNGLSSPVNQVTTAAQLIPLGIVIILIIAFIRDLRNGVPGSGHGSGGSGGSHSSSSGVGGSTEVSSSFGITSSGPSSSSGGWRYPRPPGPHRRPSPGTYVPGPPNLAPNQPPDHPATDPNPPSFNSGSSSSHSDPPPPAPNSPESQHLDPGSQPPSSPLADLAAKLPAQSPPAPPPAPATTTEKPEGPATPPLAEPVIVEPPAPIIINVSPSRGPRPYGPRSM